MNKIYLLRNNFNTITHLFIVSKYKHINSTGTIQNRDKYIVTNDHRTKRQGLFDANNIIHIYKGTALNKDTYVTEC